MVQGAKKKMRFPDDSPLHKQLEDETDKETEAGEDDCQLTRKRGGSSTSDESDTGAADGSDPVADAARRPLGVMSDYLSSEHLIWHVTSFLDVKSLSSLAQVNSHAKALSYANDAGWTRLCHKVWHSKVHVCKEARQSTDARWAYRRAWEDSRRTFLLEDELVYDPETHQGTVWSFRFKESAGRDWTAIDPWYSGRPCRQMVFLRDGSVKNYNAPESPSFSSTSTASSAEAELPTLSEPPLATTWRFLHRPMDFPTRPTGSYVRLRVGGRDVPTYAVRRSPTHNWGFIMESCWGLFASFHLPPRVIHHYSTSRTEWEGYVPPVQPLQDDSNLLITNELQWREAFLYNVGARELPEGDEQTERFDRAWRGA
jgi:hypothetical protein